MIVVKELDRLSYVETCENFGVSWLEEIKPSDNDRDTIDVTLSKFVKIEYAYGVLSVTVVGAYQIAFDESEFKEITIT